MQGGDFKGKDTTAICKKSEGRSICERRKMGIIIAVVAIVVKTVVYSSCFWGRSWH